MKKRGLEPETVSLPHDTEGYWMGNKDAKNVVIFFHGMYNSHLIFKISDIPGTCNLVDMGNPCTSGRLIF